MLSSSAQAYWPSNNREENMRKAGILTAAVLCSALAAPVAQASVTESLSLSFASGATFSGTATFVNDFSYYTGVSGTLTGYQAGTSGFVGSGSDSFNWVWGSGGD